MHKFFSVCGALLAKQTKVEMLHGKKSLLFILLSNNSTINNSMVKHFFVPLPFEV